MQTQTTVVWFVMIVTILPSVMSDSDLAYTPLLSTDWFHLFHCPYLLLSCISCHPLSQPLNDHVWYPDCTRTVSFFSLTITFAYSLTALSVSWWNWKININKRYASIFHTPYLHILHFKETWFEEKCMKLLNKHVGVLTCFCSHRPTEVFWLSVLYWVALASTFSKGVLLQKSTEYKHRNVNKPSCSSSWTNAATVMLTVMFYVTTLVVFCYV